MGFPCLKRCLPLHPKENPATLVIIVNLAMLVVVMPVKEEGHMVVMVELIMVKAKHLRMIRCAIIGTYSCCLSLLLYSNARIFHWLW